MAGTTPHNKQRTERATVLRWLLLGARQNLTLFVMLMAVMVSATAIVLVSFESRQAFLANIIDITKTKRMRSDFCLRIITLVFLAGIYAIDIETQNCICIRRWHSALDIHEFPTSVTLHT